jgi:hypothetical protein
MASRVRCAPRGLARSAHRSNWISISLHAVTTYNIGYCERSLGRYTRARKMLAKALDDHNANGEKELPSELVTAATGYLSEAEKQMPESPSRLRPRLPP